MLLCDVGASLEGCCGEKKPGGDVSFLFLFFFSATCRGYGDPHYITYDDRSYEFQG